MASAGVKGLPEQWPWEKLVFQVPFSVAISIAGVIGDAMYDCGYGMESSTYEDWKHVGRKLLRMCSSVLPVSWLRTCTRWAPTRYKWSYDTISSVFTPVTPFIRPFIGGYSTVSPFITGRGSTL